MKFLLSFFLTLSAYSAQEYCAKYLVSQYYYPNKNSLNKALKSLSSRQHLKTKINTIKKIDMDINIKYNHFLDQLFEEEFINTKEILKKQTQYVKKNLVPINNKIVQGLSKILDKKKISYQIVINERYGQEVLEFFPNNSSQLEQTLNKLIPRAEVNKIQFNFLENSLIQSQAAYFSQEKILDIGLDGFVAFLKGKQLDGLIRHEMTHAIFEKLRTKAVSSIYHGSFSASRVRSLGHSGYSSYMSLEELYTFARHPFWDSDFLINPTKKQFKQTRQKLINLVSLVEQTHDVALQSYYLSEEFILVMRSIIQTPGLGNVKYLSKRGFRVPPEKAYWARVQDPYGRTFDFFIDAQKRNFLTNKQLSKKQENRLLRSALADLTQVHKIADKIRLFASDHQKILSFEVGALSSSLDRSRITVKEIKKWQNIFRDLRVNLRSFAREVQY